MKYTNKKVSIMTQNYGDYLCNHRSGNASPFEGVSMVRTMVAQVKLGTLLKEI
jgi:hypothetical protein